MTLQSETAIDRLGWKILRELQQDARLSYSELGRRVGLSAPATAERVRKLEEGGVIRGYQACIDLAQVGFSVTAFVRLRCTLGKCLLNSTRLETLPEIREVHKVSGKHCTLLKIAATTVGHLDAVVDQLSTHGEVEADIVLSSPMTNRHVTSGASLTDTDG